MTEKHKVDRVAELKSVSATASGEAALFIFTGKDGELGIQVPYTDLPYMIGFSGQAAAKCDQIRQANPNLKFAIPFDWWEFGTDAEGKQLVVTLRIAGNANVSFSIGNGAIPLMIEVLQAMVGQGSAPDSAELN